MTQPDTLPQHLSSELSTHHIIQVAHSIRAPEIGTHARAIILKEIWSPKPQDIFKVLSFGIQMDDRDIIGAALYQIMIAPSVKLENNEELRNVRRRNELHFGIAIQKCILLWGKLFNSWGSQLSEELLGSIWKTLAKGDNIWFDVVGKVSLARDSVLPTGSIAAKKKNRSLSTSARLDVKSFLPNLDIKLDEIKKNMFSMFGFRSLADIDLGFDGPRNESPTDMEFVDVALPPEPIAERHWTLNASRGSMVLCNRQMLYRVRPKMAQATTPT